MRSSEHLRRVAAGVGRFGIRLAFITETISLTLVPVIEDEPFASVGRAAHNFAIPGGILILKADIGSGSMRFPS
ncbi:hypothetical protein PTI98_009324 [Pleurotus ostreatus]|nr:hypothetical protein PTI98_009324 [Pleurotus ostreatus]